jgi:hypothetical protein
MSPDPTMPPDPASIKAELAKALLQEYVSIRQEVVLHVQLYKTQERNAAILIPLAGLLIPLLVGRSISVSALGANATVNLSPWTDLLILFGVSTVAFFLAFSVLAVQYALQVLGVRSERLEDEINDCFDGRRHFFWEHVVPEIWSNKSKLLYKMPDLYVPLLSSLLILIFAFVLPLVAITQHLCRAPDLGFTFFVFLYVWYLLAVMRFGAHITGYVTGPELREDCRKSFQHALTGGSAPLIRSGLDVLRNIGAVTFAIALALVLAVVWIAPRYPTFCTYLESSGPISNATPSPKSSPITPSVGADTVVPSR